MDKTIVSNIFAESSAKAGELTRGQTFYTDGQGLKHCVVCNRKLETLISIPHLGIKNMKVNCICDCTEKQRNLYREELKMLERQAELGKLQTAANMKLSLKAMTFENDDSPSTYVSSAARAWTDRFTPHCKWLFIYGGCGTGKTFYAACIANAILQKGYSVKFVTLADIEAELFGSKAKADIYSELASVDLLVLDDMISDRMTDYTHEILFKLIDDRYKNDGTMIITTNMTDEETGNPKDRRMERVMSRLWGKAIPIKCEGKDRRKIQGAWK